MAGATIAVTGSTGRLGGRVARRLAAQGVPQRLVVRDPARAPTLPGAEVRAASYGDRAALGRALEGVETLLFVSAAESRDRLRQHATVVEAAAASGVRHVVYTSFFGAAPDATFTLARDHAATEALLRDAGVAWTFLRDNLYLDFFPMMVGDDGVIRGPAGQGRAAAVAQDDIADAAAAVLRDPAPHASRTYDLTGPAALGLDEVAEALAQHLGRSVRYVEETVEEAYRSRERYGAERWQVDAWVSTYLAIAAGELERVTRDVERVAGHPATPLAQVLRRITSST
ncbi:MAG TPA: SDR family oxidoreductase [Anaeromyxobacteraceae bacterium]|nr:SDR family oxidoreductase [Anaeromyxobacteraceae bacterium]